MKETPHKLVSRYLEMKTTINMAMRKNQRMRPSPPLPGISATPRHSCPVIGGFVSNIYLKLC